MTTNSWLITTTPIDLVNITLTKCSKHIDRALFFIPQNRIFFLHAIHSIEFSQFHNGTVITLRLTSVSNNENVDYLSGGCLACAHKCAFWLRFNCVLKDINRNTKSPIVPLIRWSLTASNIPFLTMQLLPQAIRSRTTNNAQFPIPQFRFVIKSDCCF